MIIHFNEVEIYLRVFGKLPNGDDPMPICDLHRMYKKYSDMVMLGEKCTRGRIYEIDGLFDYAMDRFKETKPSIGGKKV